MKIILYAFLFKPAYVACSNSFLYLSGVVCFTLLNCLLKCAQLL